MEAVSGAEFQFGVRNIVILLLWSYRSWDLATKSLFMGKPFVPAVNGRKILMDA